jgi:hypothetical protein
MDPSRFERPNDRQWVYTRRIRFATSGKVIHLTTQT